MSKTGRSGGGLIDIRTYESLEKVIKVTPIKLTRVVVSVNETDENSQKVSGNSLWEQYWDATGNKLFQRKLETQELG